MRPVEVFGEKWYQGMLLLVVAEIGTMMKKGEAVEAHER